MASPWILGRALSASQAVAQASAFREVMKTLEQPACIKLLEKEKGSAGIEKELITLDKTSNAHADAACRPSPLEPPEMTATFPLSEKRVLKFFSWVWAFASTAIVAEGEIWDGNREEKS